MKNKIEDLRNHLFETLEALKDPDRPMDLDRARAIAEVSDRIIDSAKVEVKFMEITGEKGSGFLPQTTIEGLPSSPATPRLVKV